MKKCVEAECRRLNVTYTELLTGCKLSVKKWKDNESSSLGKPWQIWTFLTIIVEIFIQICHGIDK